MNTSFAIPAATSMVDNETAERLHRAADAAASWEVILHPPAKSSFQERVSAVREMLKKLEMRLAGQPFAPVSADPQLVAQRSAALELEANYRVLRAAVFSVSDRQRHIAALPRIIGGPRQDEPRLAAVARAYLRAVSGEFSAETFLLFVHALQAHEPLLFNELWSIEPFLRFTLLEIILNESLAMFRPSSAVSIPLLMNHLRSLRSVAQADWISLIEPLIEFDAFLRQDPAGVFVQMDFQSRESYRERVALIARRSDCTESQVARAALELAKDANESGSNEERVRRRHQHVGYYLVDDGFPLLAARVGFHPSFGWKLRTFVRAQADECFLNAVQITTILAIAAVMFPVLPLVGTFTGIAAIVILLFLPATQIAVDLVNNTIVSFFDPVPLPKLDFSSGIPLECATLAAVPTLLLDEPQVRKLVNDLEVRYLGNRDPRLHFALLTDLPDSASKPREKDSHPLVELAGRLIDDLNRKYQASGRGAFLLLHRHRIYNMRQGVWMGWERKRGKLLDLNSLLSGGRDAFPIKAGPVDVLQGIRYILTLDSDTQLPRGEAARLVGAIAHPLNQAIVDARLRIVTAGYGILQPRIGVAVHSTARSRLASIFSGRSGFDVYARAISDAYQDLFGEGIFTGKGIYEVATLHAVLDHRFPRNSLLSHDLIEGAYARVGLATDVELVDDYPTHYSAYIRRKHRWVRGDWQVAQWMFSRVPDEHNNSTNNPISSISRWKIFDNLRRSLVDPSFFVLFIAGWIRLPGGPLYWTIVPLLLLFSPVALQLAFGIARALLSRNRGHTSEAFAGFRQGALVALLRLAFLPHETLLAIDAIVRSLVRRLITGERLLEWETAAQSERQSSSRTPFERYLGAAPFLASAVGLLAWWLAADHRVLLYAAPILALWILANPITVWLNRPPRDEYRMAPKDRKYLRSHAQLIWRYFYEFGGERHNYLIPDNVMEEGSREAPRVSPTNIGLLLNARQAACELGFLTIPEFASLTRSTLATLEQMEKYRGHLYNWYDSRTLRPLDSAPFVSSVDSGNLVASLFTLHSGTRKLVNKPLVGLELFSGIRASMELPRSSKSLRKAITRLNVPRSSAGDAAWLAWLTRSREMLTTAKHSPAARQIDAWWLDEALHRVEAALQLINDVLPWARPNFAPLRMLPELGIQKSITELSSAEALAVAEKLQIALANGLRAMDPDEPLSELAEGLRVLLPPAVEKLRGLIAELRRIEEDAERLAFNTDFSFLVDPDRQILSIGYQMGANRPHGSCYDLLASEARMATFLAVARGDLPQKSWFKLGRDHARIHRRFLLFSWSGTMFEYLMPSLWMRGYPGTLIERTQEAVVQVQQAFGQSLHIPWGVSESASSRKNENGHYVYHPYGLPRISIWLDATAGPVISPYSTFLAMAFDPLGSLRNLRRMQSAGWVGTYGFYESADFSVSGGSPGLAREWMAHHLGMSLLAVTNLLRGNIVQHWFHAHPHIQATEMLLQEVPVSRAVLRAKWKELAPIRTTSRVPAAYQKTALKAAL